MSDGRDVLSLLDSDLLEYSANLDIGAREVNAWRSLSNLHERLTLLMLYIQRQTTRYPELQDDLDGITTALRDLEQQMAGLVSSRRPGREAILQSAEQGAPEDDLPQDVFEAIENICRLFRLNGGQIDLSLKDPVFDPLLRGFYGAEPNGRWSGPFTTSSILLPVRALRAAGVRQLTFRLILAEFYDPAKINIFFGSNIEERGELVTREGRDIGVDLSGLDDQINRVVFSINRTRNVGEDPRLLGFMLGSLSLAC